MINVLLALTDSSLDYARSERSDWLALRAVEVTEVAAPVTIVSLSRAIRQANGGGLVIIGHGGPDGIPLPDGKAEILDYATLAPLVRGRFEWLYLATCDSQLLADKLAVACGVLVLCTVTDVQDKTAYVVGSSFAADLDAGYGFQQAAWRARGTRSWKLAQPSDGDPFRNSYLVAV